MTTRLSGRNTRFLPFNQGRGTGAGNPDNPGGYKTAYLWEKVLARQSFLDIVAGFIHLQIEEKKLGGKKVSLETMIFPRYHQLDCVRQLVTGAREHGAGTNFLVSTRPAAANRTPSPGWPTAWRAFTTKRTKRSMTRSSW
jgi:type I restriction enzyme R subunit